MNDALPPQNDALHPSYGRGVAGWSAGVNSAEWFSCPRCGTCIIETDRSVKQRDIHNEWHRSQDLRIERLVEMIHER